jgi:hypothetical protein
MGASDMQYLRSANNDDTGANGGFPLNELLQPSLTFPRTFSAQNPLVFSVARKIFRHYKSDAQAAQYASYGLFDVPWTDKGNHYFNILPCGNRDTWADVEPDLATLPRYGVGHLTAEAAIGATSITVDVKNAALASGIERIFRADGVSVTDNLMLDKRSAPGTPDPTQHEEVIATNAVAVGSIVSITLSTALVNAYPVGAKVRNMPDKVDMVAAISNVDKSLIGTTTFAEGNIVTYRAGTWEDTITLEMTNSTSYRLTSLRYGLHGTTFSKSADASPIWTGLSSPQFKIPAGTIAGTNVAGHKVVFDTNAAMLSSFLVYHHPANANVMTATVTDGIMWEE